MHIFYVVIAIAALAMGLCCAVIVLIDMFQDEIWKGLAGLLCGLYWLYYALFEFEHENKWLIVIGAIGGNSIAGAFFQLAGFSFD